MVCYQIKAGDINGLLSNKGGRYKWSVIQPLHLGDGQGKKQTFEYQSYPYPLLQAHLDR